MNRAKLSEKQVEELANEIRDFLIDNLIWVDVRIYFNGKCYATDNPDTREWSYNDRDKLFVLEDMNPSDFFDYVADDHILSMSFEGGLYDVINYSCGEMLEKFDAIFQKYGVYYELGNAWNLTCYYI